MRIGQLFSTPVRKRWVEVLITPAMQLHEYQRNYELEQNYWWFVGVRAMVRSLLSLSPGHGRLGKVLDVGCGTGALLDQLQACSAEVWGLDISHEALKYCMLRGHKHLNENVLSRPYWRSPSVSWLRPSCAPLCVALGLSGSRCV
jgi:2-polyprenyl-3-methyl-5-hydroxy-6-metoxy-1,4-benzoquinol methylase